MAPELVFLLLLLARANTEEVSTPSSLLRPRNFNHHAFNAKQFLRELKAPQATKQGPVLFPNDAPPPPRPPLIVTSRPLTESIARSELNNSISEQSRISNVIRPLFRINDYKPYDYALASSAPLTSGDFEDRTALPPIYRAISDHANQRVLDVQRQNNRYDYQVNEPVNYNRYKSNVVDRHEDDGRDDQNNNYAFSYTVKDHKTGDDFSHSQHSSGSATNGEYRVRLPDGRMQIVSYTADENGYQADVRYDEEENPVRNTIDSDYDKTDHFSNQKPVYDSHYNDKPTYNDYKDKNYGHDDFKSDAAQKFRTPTNNDYYNQYADVSKEYYNDDFSSEFDSKSYDYAPHTSKFSAFTDSNQYLSPASKSTYAASTVTPNYDELKALLVTKKAYNTIQPYLNKISADINPPTAAYDFTTERVVVISPKKTNLYTNIASSLPSESPVTITPSTVSYEPLNFNNFAVSTPSTYLISTIASLRNKVDLSGPKPILSNSYIDKIKKYLTFN
ncbi:hypothetical protein ACJJTC_015242 [Scirpophaga incertulas]